MHTKWYLLFALLALLGPIATSAQVIVVEDSIFPANPKPHTWLFHPRSHEVWAYEEGKWQPREGKRPDSVSSCGPLVILHDGPRPTATTDAHKTNYLVDELYCTDSLGVVVELGLGIVFDYAGRMMGYGCGWELKQPPPLLKVQGKDAFMVLQGAPDMFGGSKDPNRKWGIIGTNGVWLVPPLYSSPIEFKNGIADVIYQGKKRKINERGEILN